VLVTRARYYWFFLAEAIWRGNSLFLKVKEGTITNYWDKMEIPVL